MKILSSNKKLLLLYLFIFCILLLFFIPVWYIPINLGLIYQDEQKIIDGILRGEELININDPAIFFLYSKILSANQITLLVPLTINLALILIQIKLIFKIIRVKYITYCFLLAALPLQQFAYIYGPSKDIIVVTAIVYFLYCVSNSKFSIFCITISLAIIIVMKPLYLGFVIMIYLITARGKTLPNLIILLFICAVFFIVFFYNVRAELNGYDLNFEQLSLYLKLDYSNIYGDAYNDIEPVPFPIRLISYIIGPLQEIIWSSDPYYRFQDLISKIVAIKLLILYSIILKFIFFGKVNWRYFFLSFLTLLIISLLYFGVNYRYRILFEIFVSICFISSSNKRAIKDSRISI